LILDAIVRAAYALLAAVDRCVGCTTNVELGERVILDLDRIAGLAFAYSLDLLGL
jgi:hypothetical protein